MRRLLFLCPVLALLLLPDHCLAQKAAVDASVKAHSAEAWEMALKIWDWAEVGFKEEKSSKLLADALEKAGFQVERGVAKIPTAFVATIGAGKPVIGIMGEYDALPGLSQEAVPYRKPKAGIGAGHACGHHLFGAASLSAALALAEQIKAGKIKGTLKYYGCPAEEGGSARVFMVRDGLFQDCDIALHWHPSSGNGASTQSNLARVGAKFQFYGTASHAAGAPELGASALDAVELTNHAAQLLREHTPDFTRIHHIITYGGGAPNVVPEFAEVFYYVRHPEADIVRKVYEKLVKCAKAGALATDTELEIIYLGGTVQMIPNAILADLALKNMQQLNDLKYNDEEIKFALKIQETLEKKPPLGSVGESHKISGGIGKGSTDVSDVSWVVPTGGFYTSCWVPGTPGHSWQAVAAGGTTIGKKGMVLAARVMAANAWDLFHDPKLITAAKVEHQQRLAGRTYKSLLLPGQPPPLDYRDPPKPKVKAKVKVEGK
jgi:aminobenzoyl-glutamate utilization protein B